MSNQLKQSQKEAFDLIVNILDFQIPDILDEVYDVYADLEFSDETFKFIENEFEEDPDSQVIYHIFNPCG